MKFNTTSMIFLFLALTSACNQNTDFAKAPEVQKVVDPSLNLISETFQQELQNKKMDVVWIVDNSGSMGDEQENIAANFDAWITDFVQEDVDFKMAITTTDVSSAAKAGAIVPGSDTLLTSTNAAADPVKFKDDFKRLIKVGISGSGDERGLQASEAFLQKSGMSFLRPDAFLIFILVTDEKDSSPKLAEEYTTLMRSFKKNEGLVKFYSIVDLVDVEANLALGPDHTLIKDYTVSQLTGAKSLDIKSDFAQSLTNLSEELISLLDSFPLSQAANPATLIVKVNGVPSQNYTYDSGTRSIKFDSGSIPAPGARIEVKYQKEESL